MSISQKFNITKEREDELSTYVNDLVLKYGPNFDIPVTLYSIFEDKSISQQEKIIIAFMYGVVIVPKLQNW